MDQLIPGLAELVAPFRDRFRAEVFQTVQVLIAGWAVWIAVDDTPCHKRGAKVAFGGIFLDPVLSTRKHKPRTVPA